MNRTLSDDSKEKPVIAHVEDTNHLQKTESGIDYNSTSLRGDEVHHDAAFERRVIRKVDIRLLIILGALYSIALIDRTNLSAARVAGMAKELKLCGFSYHPSFMPTNADTHVSLGRLEIVTVSQHWSSSFLVCFLVSEYLAY